ncbi:MAG: glycosyltransferase family 39 protein [Methylacidiphilales bacterium]|nr:glycosyltransferase family 39 protein [Candidatus Methylacidiphilales bacterium]
MHASASSPRFLGLSPAWAAVLVIGVATVFRFFYAVWLPLLPDEAYYLQWSRHLDASYFSKGPAIAYTIWAGTALFGSHNCGVRFFAVLLSAGTAWQIFLLARRWYDEVTALVAVLIAGVVPLFALGAVVMTIDPLSAFFWVWAANLFSRAIQDGLWRDWLLTGFAIGCGFLAKYLNALELVAFLVFLLLVPERRRLLGRPQFWTMAIMALICALPVFWWNWQHGWVSAAQLGNRGHLEGRFDLHFSTFFDFLSQQALVISPLLFLALLAAACRVLYLRAGNGWPEKSEGELLLLILFLTVFLFYVVLAWHLRGEPNWPAVSYLTLIVILASRWRQILDRNGSARYFISAAFLLAWLQTVVFHDPEVLPLSFKTDPMSRVVGWTEIAGRLDDIRHEQNADVLIADAYKEASILSFHLPDQGFIYTVRHDRPATQYDFWPTYPTSPPHRALWITETDENKPAVLAHDFSRITPIEYMIVSFHGRVFRQYTVYLCENP